jgi:5-formyltetrahydrofolate cyclo-ligase
MTKEEIRTLFRSRRNVLSQQEAGKMLDLMLINFQQIILPFLNCIHTYIASEKLHEADTLQLVRYLQFRNPGLKVLVPKMDIASGNLLHIEFNGDVVMVPNSFGISEPEAGAAYLPEEIDLVLVPLLAFDTGGHRVGYGKGYYDKFLSACRADAIKVGLSFFGPVDQIDNISPFDIPLNYCITPQQLFEFH